MKINKNLRSNLITYGIVIIAFIFCQLAISPDVKGITISRVMRNQLVPVCAYISAIQVTPVAIISARPRPVPAATARASSLASAGKMKSLSQLCRSWPPP